MNVFGNTTSCGLTACNNRNSLTTASNLALPERIRLERLHKTISTIEKRAEYLARRIANSHKDLSYDKQEHAALRHALEILASHEAACSSGKGCLTDAH
jgi:hypothetical protein